MHELRRSRAATEPRQPPRSKPETRLKAGRHRECRRRSCLILNDAEGRKTLAIAFFETEDDYRQGDETLNQMSAPGEGAPDGMGQRTAVDKYEVALELEA